MPAPDMKATRELEMALIGLPRADPPTPPTPSPVCSVHELMEGTLKDYEEECVEEGTFQADPAKEVGEWEEHDHDQMETQLNDLLYQSSSSIHPLCQPPDPIWPVEVQVPPRRVSRVFV